MNPVLENDVYMFEDDEEEHDEEEFDEEEEN